MQQLMAISALAYRVISLRSHRYNKGFLASVKKFSDQANNLIRVSIYTMRKP